MKRLLCSAAAVVAVACTGAQANPNTISAYGNVPLRFEPNLGQTDPQVQYVSRAGAYTLFLTRDEAVWRTRDRRSAVRMRFVGANAAPRIEAEGLLSGRNNYLLGNLRSRWISDVPQYARIVYRGVYAGVDLIFYGKEQKLEYDLVLAPGADPGKIRLEFTGAEGMLVDNAGDLVIHTAGGDIRQRTPVVYQQRGGARKLITSRYVLNGTRVAFDVKSYDRSRELIIDPELTYSTFIGGSGSSGQIGLSTAVDASGSAYITGVTDSLDFPTTPGAYSTARKSSAPSTGDVFVSKLKPDGSDIVYSTFIGGASDQLGTGIAVDPDGNAYVLGATNSADFPVTSGAYRTKRPATNPNNYNGFLLKLNPTGSALVYSTYLGGASDNWFYGLTIDAKGNAYAAGVTASPDYPTTSNASQRAFGGGDNDAVLTVVDPAGANLVYSTFLGGNDRDVAYSVALDTSGNVYIGGTTRSKDFPLTSGAMQPKFAGGIRDAWIAVLNPNGNSLIYSSYIGGGGDDQIHGLALDSTNNLYVTGSTNSSDFPITKGVVQTQFGGGSDLGAGDVFVAKLDITANKVLYATYYGGSGNDSGLAIAVDNSGAAYVRATTDDATGLPLGPLTEFDYAGGFVFKLLPDASEFEYATMILGSDIAGIDCYCLALDGNGSAYTTGAAQQYFAITPGAFQKQFKGKSSSTNAFVKKFSTVSSPVELDLAINAAGIFLDAFAPGEVIALFGKGLGPDSTINAQPSAQGAIDTSLGGTRVFFGDTPAPVLSAKSNIVIAVAPYGVFQGAFKVTVPVRAEVNGQKSNVLYFPVTEASPGIFTVDASGTGQAQMTNEDGTPNSQSNPAAKGSTVSALVTGLGQTNPAGADGQIAADSSIAPLLPVQVAVGNVRADVVSVSSVSGQVAGIMQVKFKVPPTAVSGTNRFYIRSGNTAGYYSQAATFVVQ